MNGDWLFNGREIRHALFAFIAGRSNMTTRIFCNFADALVVRLNGTRACRRYVVVFTDLWTTVYGIHVINRREHYYLFRFRFAGVRGSSWTHALLSAGNRTSRVEVRGGGGGGLARGVRVIRLDTATPQPAATRGCVRARIGRKFSDKLPRRSSLGDSCPEAK
jgi:hypothetical protein